MNTSKSESGQVEKLHGDTEWKGSDGGKRPGLAQHGASMLSKPGKHRMIKPNHATTGATPKRRGPRRFGFTYSDIAAVAGLAPDTVKRKATGKRREFRPAELESLVTWLAVKIWQRRARNSR